MARFRRRGAAPGPRQSPCCSAAAAAAPSTAAADRLHSGLCCEQGLRGAEQKARDDRADDDADPRAERCARVEHFPRGIRNIATAEIGKNPVTVGL